VFFSASFQSNVYAFQPPNHLLSPLSPFLTLLPLSDPSTPLFLLPGPRPSLDVLRSLAQVLEKEVAVDWDERRFLRGGRRNKWGRRKEVEVGSMYM
jgi:hypothetical protein